MAVGSQFSREASVYLAGFVGAGIVQFLAILVYSRSLGPEQYGYLTLTVAMATAWAGVMVLGGDVALTRFWIDAPLEAAKRALASTWIGFLTAWSVVVAVIACMAAPILAQRFGPGADLTPLLIVGFLGLVPAQASRLLAQILRNRFRPVAFAATTVLISAGNVAIGITFGVVLGLGAYGIVLGMLLGETIGCLIRVPLTRASLGRSVDWHLLPPLLRFGIPYVPASIAAWTLTGVDRLVVGMALSPTELGAYGLAATFVGPFIVVNLALGQAWVPRAYELFTTSASLAKGTTAKAVGLALAGLGGAALIVGGLAPWVVALLGGDEYMPGSVALPFLALGSAFAGTAAFAGTGLTLMKRTVALSSIAVCAAGVNVAALLVLVPRFGLVGASLAGAGSYLLLAGANLTVANLAFNVGVPPRTGLILGVLIAQSSISTLAPRSVWVFGALAISEALLVVHIRSLLRAPITSPAESRPGSDGSGTNGHQDVVG